MGKAKRKKKKGCNRTQAYLVYSLCNLQERCFMSTILIYFFSRFYFGGLPDGSEVKAPACNVGDPGLIPGLGRSPGEGNGNPLQYSCLENPMDGGTW